MGQLLEVRRVVLPFPPSANTAYPSNANGRRHLSKAGAAFKEVAGLITRTTLQGFAVDQGRRITIDIELWMPSERRADVDSYIKLPKDVLCEVLGVDDNFKIVPRVSSEALGIDRKNPRCELVVRLYE